MSDISPIQIFPGINDLPTESSATTGCNGSAIVKRVNDLVYNQNVRTGWHPTYSQEFALYVSSTNGNDANDGLTYATALATLNRAFEILAQHPIDDYWWFGIYCEGDFQTPLDLRNMQAMADSFGMGCRIDLWPYGAAYTYSISQPDINDWTQHTRVKLYESDGNALVVGISDAIINVNSTTLDIDGIDTVFQNCKFVVANETYTAFMHVGKGNHKFTNTEITTSFNSFIRCAGVDCQVVVNGTFGYTNPRTGGTAITAQDGATLIFQPSVIGNATGPFLVSTNGSTIHRPYSANYWEDKDNTSTIRYSDKSPTWKVHSLYVQTVVENQEIVILRSNGGANLKKVELTCHSGTFTATLRIGTTDYEAPVTLTGDNSFTVATITSGLVADNVYWKLRFYNVNNPVGIGVHVQYEI